MKINIFHIVYGHLLTLRFGDEGKYSKIDILLFFLFPIIIGVISFYFDVRLGKEAFGISISIFSIFSALLLNVQIALFGISQREWKADDDKLLNKLKEDKKKEKRKLLIELNTNISYLIVLSCISVTIFLLSYVVDITDRIKSPISTCLYLHFFLTLLMVIKRSHALFHKEYEIE